MNRILGAFASVLLVFLAPASVARVNDLVELGRDAPAMFNPGSAGFAIIDIDGDGREDLALTDTSENPVLAIWGRLEDGTNGLKQILPMPEQHLVHRILAWRSDDAPHIVVIDNVGTVRDFSGWPLVERRSFPIYPGVWPPHAAIGDIDADGMDDLVVPIEGALFTYAMSDGHAQRTISLPIGSGSARDVALAALDGDPALEIIVGGSMYGPGLVVDGATGAVDFEYDESFGFGNAVATGHFDGTGATGFVTDGGGLADVFTADPYALLWSANAGGNISSIATTDIDASGRDAIVVGNDQFGSVHVIDPVTHVDRYSIAHDGSGVIAVTGIDLDGDGAHEIAFGVGRHLPGAMGFAIADGPTGSVIERYVPANGPMTVTAIGDVDGDGRDELVAASQPSYSYSTIAIYDLATGAEKWRSPAPINSIEDPLFIAPAAIRLAQHKSGPGMDIIVAGSTMYDGRIEVYDGTTMAEVLRIYARPDGPLEWRQVRDVAMVDCDGDGTDDFVAIADFNDFTSRSVQLIAFSGADGSELWSSELHPNAFFAQRVLVVPTLNGGSELVAVTTGSLRAFDPSTGAPGWWLPATNDGAVYVPKGVQGPEYAVFSDQGTITFYDANNRNFLRSFPLAAPTCDAVALDGDVRSLAIATGNSMALYDGKSGRARATATSLGQCMQFATRMSSNSAGVIALGTASALFRWVAVVDDRLFADSFDPP